MSTSKWMTDHIRALLAPGVHTLDVYHDGVELCGSLHDQDDHSGWVPGAISPDVLETAFPELDITDCR